MSTSQQEQSPQYELYSLSTPNGQKVGIMLEELGLTYKSHTINIMKGVQKEDWFLKLNINGRIPVLVDHSVKKSNGESLTIMETGAILMYLAEKHGKFLPNDVVARSETIQWLMFQMGGVGPMFGQMGHFHKYAKEDCPYSKKRYLDESKRLASVLDKRLSENKYLVGDEYTIADMATYPWIVCADKFYGLQSEFDEYKNVMRWRKAIEQREAVKKGMDVTPFSEMK